MFSRNSLVKGLVNVFNLNNYYTDAVSANFTIENGKIVGLFDRNVDIEKYFAEMQKDIVARYCDDENKASEILDFKSFPFNIDESRCKYNKGEKVKKLIIDVTPGVMYNLKVHSALAFQKAVEWRVAATLEEPGQITKEEAYAFVKECIQLRKANHPYLYSISFDDDEVQGTYIDIFKLRLQVCGLKGSVFYKDEGNKIHIKDINDVNVIKSIGEYVAERIALDLKISGKKEPKVENLKDNLTDLILELTGQSIEGYDYGTFIDRNKESNFAFIPLVEKNGLSYTLNAKEANKINKVFKEKGWCKEDLLIDIKGQSGRQLGLGEPVYAITCKQLALLMPKLMKSPVEYNEREQLFEYIVPLDKNQVEEALNSNAKTPPSERPISHNLAVPIPTINITKSNSTGSDSISSSDSTRSSIRGGLRNVSSATSNLSELGRNHLAVDNEKVMSTSAHSQNSQNSVDSGLGSTFHISQLDDLKPTLQSMKYVAPNVVPLPQQSTNIAHQLPNKSDTILDDPKPVLQQVEKRSGGQDALISSLVKGPLPNKHTSNDVKPGQVPTKRPEMSGEYNSSISSHTSSNGSLSGKPQANMSITSKLANKTSQEKPKDLSSSTSIRSSFKNLNVFKHTRGVNTYKSDQREKSSCSIL